MVHEIQRHPSESDLTLYSTGDLGTFDQFRVRWHLRSCARCDNEVNAMGNLVAALRSHSDDLPPGVQWDKLSAEMTANIHLGLEAGECVGPVKVRKPERIGWSAAIVMAAMTLVLFCAWALNPPRGRQVAIQRPSPVEIRTAPGGIEVKENGSALTLLHTRGQQTPIFISTPGSLRARFVDSDTGQVTINNVYSD
jgi:hypothetical protein